MNRWLASRWLVLSMVGMAGAFYLSIIFSDPGTFAQVTMVALGGGHITNMMRDSRGDPRNPGYSEELGD